MVNITEYFVKLLEHLVKCRLFVLIEELDLALLILAIIGCKHTNIGRYRYDVKLSSITFKEKVNKMLCISSSILRHNIGFRI